jgi:hypothetical protein
VRSTAASGLSPGSEIFLLARIAIKKVAAYA